MNKPRLSPEEVISSLYHTEKWKAEMAKNPVAGAFSPQFESYDAGTGHMICSYPTLEEFKNPISVVHGGIIAGMLDTAAWPAARRAGLRPPFLWKPNICGPCRPADA